MALIKAGDLASAGRVCADGLAWCRELGDLANLSGQLRNRTILDLRTGRVDRAAAHLREQLQIATQTGLQSVLLAGLDSCGHVCAATGRPAEAVTAWAAMSALSGPWPLPPWPPEHGRTRETPAETPGSCSGRPRPGRPRSAVRP